MKEPWTNDKRFVLGFILAIVGQTVGAVWWASNIDARVAKLEDTQIAASDQDGRIIRLETMLASVQSELARINGKLDRLIEFRTGDARP